MEELLAFLTRYTEEFERMEQKQAEKLGLLMTKELDKIEQATMMQQAMEKQIESMEKKRVELFSALGFAGMGFQELAATAPQNLRIQFTDLYRRLDGAIGNIRYYNEKAQELAKTELDRMGIDTRFVGNPTGIYGGSPVNKGQHLEKKA